MKDHTEVMNKIKRYPKVRYTALVPKEHGFEDVLAAKLSEITVFTTASETFSRKNTNSSIEESLNCIARIIEREKQNAALF